MELTPPRGSVLSCYFPMNENPDIPGPQARPCLVLGSFPNPKNREQRMLIMAYGTSRKSRANFGFEVRIDTEEKMKATGLHRPTRFTLNRLRILPLGPEYFEYTTTGTPYLGEIPFEEKNALAGYLGDLAHHADELNFFRPKEAIAKGLVFNPIAVDEYMKQKLNGVQILRNKRGAPRNIYRRSRLNEPSAASATKVSAT